MEELSSGIQNFRVPILSTEPVHTMSGRIDPNHTAELNFDRIREYPMRLDSQ